MNILFNKDYCPNADKVFFCWPAAVDGSRHWGRQHAAGPPGWAERANLCPARPSVTPWSTPWRGGWPLNSEDYVAERKRQGEFAKIICSQTRRKSRDLINSKDTLVCAHFWHECLLGLLPLLLQHLHLWQNTVSGSLELPLLCLNLLHLVH